MILHLSDLHLGGIDTESLPNDYKSEVVAKSERATQWDMLRHTLTELGEYLHDPLDAIVISGDVTDSHLEDGFKRLEELLACLGAARPVPSGVVIVPGNHDVKWGAVDSAERYGLFLKYVRDKGYVTPYLEGIDPGATASPTSFERHCHISPHGNWAVVPINSAHYCGREESIHPILQDAIRDLVERLEKSGLARDAVETAIRRIRMHDVARLSTDQLHTLRSLANSIRSHALCKGKEPVLIAVLHHQLLPVTIREELKPFETLTNLGHFRYALRDNGFGIVLHGHKHTEHLYYDHIHCMPGACDLSTHRVLVVSANCTRIKVGPPSAIARLINIANTPKPTTVEIRNILPVEAGTKLRIEVPTQYKLWQEPSASESDQSHLIVVNGISTEDVYERAISHFLGGPKNTSLANFVCRISQPVCPVAIPDSYPQIQGVGDRQEWFDTLVEWWQKADFKRLSGPEQFNHGNRIFAYRPEVNQIEKVIQAIANSPLTSRAIVSLLRPDSDTIESDKQFPSFCFVQFLIRDAGSMCVLEAIAYFRKQEIRYWWPVNVAEIAQLHRRVFSGVEQAVKDKTKKQLISGSITTFAAIASVGDSVPKILIPALDFDLETDSQRLWDLVYALCSEAIRRKEDYPTRWATVLRSLVPPAMQNPSGVPVPVQSVEYLADVTAHFSSHHAGSLKELATALSRLAEINAKHRSEMGKRSLNDLEHSSWRKEVLATLREIRKIVEVAIESKVVFEDT